MKSVAQICQKNIIFVKLRRVVDKDLKPLLLVKLTLLTIQ